MSAIRRGGGSQIRDTCLAGNSDEDCVISGSTLGPLFEGAPKLCLQAIGLFLGCLEGPQPRPIRYA